jgi:predicted Zn-dependent protease
MMWAAAAIVFTWLLQPVTLATGPIGLAWLGMAMAPALIDASPSTEQRTRLLVALGVVMALGLFAVDQRLHRNVNRPAAFTSLTEALPPDPLLASRASDLNSAIGNVDEAVRWARRRTELEPFSAVAGARLAERLLDADRPNEAEVEIRRSLDRDPFNPTALTTALGIALVTGDEELFELAAARLDELDLG